MAPNPVPAENEPQSVPLTLVAFQRETATLPLLKTVLALIRDHFSYNRKLDPNLDQYIKAEENGALRLFTVRQGDVLIGAAIFSVGPHPHFQSETVALQDLIYIQPDSPFHGMALIRFCHQELSKEKYDSIVFQTTNDPDISALFVREGFKAVGAVYTKGESWA